MKKEDLIYKTNHSFNKYFHDIRKTEKRKNRKGKNECVSFGFI